jgi:hypothetical protein
MNVFGAVNQRAYLTTELPLGGIIEQSRKLLPLIRGFPATLVIDVLAADRMAAAAHQARRSCNWFSGSWPLSSVETLA